MQQKYHAYQAGTAPRFVDRARNTRTARQLRRKGYLTAEVVVMWIAYAVTLICNAAFEIGQLGGTTSAMVSNQVYTWFTPAGYVFSIWTLIYIALAVWLVSFTREAPARSNVFTATAGLFVASCALNVVWLAVWHFQAIGLSLIAIIGLWAVLAALYVRTRRSASSAVGWVPISIYTAWVTVATIANMAQLVTRVLDGGLPFLNAVATILIVAGVMTLGYIMKKGYSDTAFPLVILWAVIGVGVHVAEASILTAIIVFALAVVGAVFTFAGADGLRSWRRS